MAATMFPLGWQHYLLGGLLIGSGVSLLYLMTGWIGGMSTVFSTSWSYLSRRPFFRQASFVATRGWRLVFALGLVLGAAAWWLWQWPAGAMPTQVPAWQLGLGGLLVGFGSRWSNGCTSGHGICGLASLQWPSLAAVLTFMGTGFATAQLVAFFGGR